MCMSWRRVGELMQPVSMLQFEQLARDAFVSFLPALTGVR